MIWGLLDLSFGATLLAGRVPIYSDLHSAKETATSISSLFPVAVTALSTYSICFCPGFRDSSLLRKPLGVMLAYAQLPFRLGLVVPSLFFIPWLVAPLPHRIAIAVDIVLIGSSELFKVWSLWFWERQIVVASYAEPDNT
jgi:hypothetical protein